LIGFLSFSIYFSLFTKKFSRYLNEITEGIKELSTGNFNAVIPLREEDEFTDIARQLNRMAKDIKDIMEKERSVENEKNELITNVAHDLRTPLTSIIGYLDIVSNKELQPDLREKYIGIAYSKSKRLEKLIDDLFMYTKFEFGQVALRLDQVDIIKLMEQLLDEFYPSFCDNGLEYELKVSAKHIMVEADGNLLARAFANLIGNAIKYGKNGKNINISLDTTQTQIIASIVNFGEIIPKKDIDKIFEKFYRVDSSRNTELGGSGLGLAIAKNIITMHNGTIQVRSSLEGTVFAVTLNLEGQDE
jgi:signal transduction histidine kinase